MTFLFSDRTSAPAPGTRSMTDAEIVQAYQYWLGRPPDSTELASEQDNSTRYGAAGIERQIANRAGNAPSTGIRGDEGLPDLTTPYVPPAHVGSVVTMGPAAVAPPGGLAPSGPTGLAQGYYGGPTAPGGVPLAGGSYYGGSAGLSSTTLLILAAAAAAAIYFLVIRK